MGAQHLSKREKAFHMFYLYDNPDFRKARLNPLRRLWQAPGEAFERALRPAVGLKHANTVKFLVGKALWGIGAAWAITYYAYYNSEAGPTMEAGRCTLQSPQLCPTTPTILKRIHAGRRQLVITMTWASRLEEQP